jgi:SAM-dependent methyltransferase
VVEDGLTIRRGDVADLDGQFDLIMSHHSVEHIPEPAVFFRQLRRLVAGDGRILVRTPLADSWTYAHYGSDWWALDAPRHLHVFTTKAIHLLATRAGLRILDESRDSDPMQFHASELYRRGETLAGRTLLELDEQTVDEYRRRARELNDRRTGDFGVFWLAV